MGAIDRGEGLTLREAAAARGLSMGTVRGHIRAGRLAAVQSVGKFGPEWRIRPAVLAAFAADRLGLTLDAAALRRPQQGQGGQALGGDTRELYERLLTATEEATRYRALAAASEDARAAAEREHAATVAELRHERDAAREKAEAAQAEAAAAAADLARQRSRGFWGRLFGGSE